MASRLKQLRLARGLSLEALAADMGGVVTKQALSKYEAGETKPSPVVANKLAAALHVKSAHLWTPPSIHVEIIAYRKSSKLSKTDAQRVESVVAEVMEHRVRLQELTQQPPVSPKLVRALRVQSLLAAEEAAREVRKQWKLGVDPVASVTGILEDHSFHVIEIEADEGFDGISALAKDESNVTCGVAVVSRAQLPGERQRFNLLHELGHVVMDVAEDVDQEKAAHRFASAFLMPAEVLHREVGHRRTAVSLSELQLLKRRFGVSLQALVFRLRALDIIPESHARTWWMMFNKRGWKKSEPEPLPTERPQWLRQAVLRVYSEGQISRTVAEEMLGEPMGDDVPLSLVERRAFLKLPIEHRRKLMAEQAEKLVGHYQAAVAAGDLDGSDFVEG